MQELCLDEYELIIYIITVFTMPLPVLPLVRRNLRWPAYAVFAERKARHRPLAQITHFNIICQYGRSAKSSQIVLANES